GNDRHGEVVAHEAGDTLDRVAQTEARGDVVTDARRCGGGERTDGRAAARLDGLTDAPVVGPEIVPPARDAVRLVDDETTDVEPSQRVDEAGRADALGREVEEAQLSRTCASGDRGARRGGDLAVQALRGDPQLVQASHLVDHQGDQRRQDEREPTGGD